jgi:hypothetical protein
MTIPDLMPDLGLPDLGPVTEAIRLDGFDFVPGATMRGLLGGLSDWNAFAASWDDLGVDTYMADGGRYRKRRHVVFRVDATGAERLPRQPHYQSRDYNTLNGGIERWFEPMEPDTASGPTMTKILGFCHGLFDRLKPSRSWFVEVHQFRIEARVGETGQPTPEGMHRDGVDYVLVLLIGRRNIQSGETSIHDLTGRTLGSFTLTDPLDAALVDDSRVMHGVTAVEPVDPATPAARDVLVVTFRAEG